MLFLTYGFTSLVVAGVLARFVFILIPGNSLKTPWGGGSDTPAYVALAQNIVTHREFGYAGQPTAFRPPGYPLLLATFIEIFGARYVAAVRVLQFGEGLVVVLLCASIARQSSGDSAAKATVLIALFLPTLVEMTGEVLTETSATALSAGVVYLLVRHRAERRWLHVAIGSVLVGLGALLRFNLAFLGCFCLWTVIFQQQGRSRWRDAAIVILVPCILISPWTLRNLSVFHRSVVFSTQGGFNALAGVLTPQGRTQPGDTEKIRAAVGWGLPAELETNSSIRSRLPDESEIDRKCQQAAFRAWRETGWSLIPLVLRKLYYFWLSTDQFFWTDALSPIQRDIRRFGVLTYWIVLLLAIPGYFAVRSNRPELASAFLAYFLVVTMLHIPFCMNTRYRVPFIDPVLAILAGVGWSRIAQRIAERPALET